MSHSLMTGMVAMHWIKIPLEDLRSDEFLGSDPVQQATWLKLLAHCADQENYGVIEDCRDWKDRRWLITAGVTLAEVAAESDLWAFVGDTLVVNGYCLNEQELVQKKRNGGSKGGRISRKSARAKKDKESLSEISKESGKGVLNEKDNILDKTILDKTKKEGDKKADAQGLLNDSDKESLTEKQKAPPPSDEMTIDVLPQGPGAEHLKPLPANDPSQPAHLAWKTPEIKELLAIGCKGAENTAPNWQRLIDLHGLKSVKSAAQGIKATERWPDKVEEQIGSNNRGLSQYDRFMVDDGEPDPFSEGMTA